MKLTDETISDETNSQNSVNERKKIPSKIPSTYDEILFSLPLNGVTS